MINQVIFSERISSLFSKYLFFFCITFRFLCIFPCYFVSIYKYEFCFLCNPPFSIYTIYKFFLPFSLFIARNFVICSFADSDPFINGIDILLELLFLIGSPLNVRAKSVYSGACSIKLLATGSATFLKLLPRFLKNCPMLSECYIVSLCS